MQKNVSAANGIFSKIFVGFCQNKSCNHLNFVIIYFYRKNHVRGEISRVAQKINIRECDSF